MTQFDFKKWLPHAGAILFFVLISLAYFFPQLEGKEMETHDQTQWKGGAKEVNDYREETGEEPLWTNSMFGGMPAYYVAIHYPSNLINKYIRPLTTLGIERPAKYVIWSLISMFILLMVLKVDIPTGVLGSIGYAFGSYNFVIMSAGHFAKVLALAYLPAIFAGAILIRRGKYLQGMALAALLMSFEMIANHPQMTYYFFVFFVAIYFLLEFIEDIRAKRLKAFVISASIFGGAVILGVLPSASQLMTSREYTPYSTRGKSELTIVDKGDQTTGLDKSYITAWSNGIGETFSLLIPNAKGGASGRLAESKTAMKAVDRKYRKQMEGIDAYWGDQPFTAGPMYAGAIIMFLFILGLFIVDGTLKWALVLAAIITTMLSWGKNFMGLTEWFIDHFPLYDKFRAVASIETVALFAFPVLAALALKKVSDSTDFLDKPLSLFGKQTKLKNFHAFIAAFALTGGLSLLFYLMPTSFFDFFKVDEYDNYMATLQKNGWPSPDIDVLLANVEAGRIAIFKSDALRSFGFITLGAAILFFAAKQKLKMQTALMILVAAVLFDMWTVNTRYLNKDNFVAKREAKVPFPLTKASQAILQDPSPDYRVLNMSVSTFNETGTSYYHHSIGGYNGAKLKKFQELVDFYIGDEIQQFATGLRSAKSFADLEPSLAGIPVLNMLNTKYIIYTPEQGPIQNKHAMGNAWFVQDVQWVTSADEEMTSLGTTDLHKKAVIREDQKQMIGSAPDAFDMQASIVMDSYAPNRLVYTTNSSRDQIAVFSEIWYPKGWIATIDGVEAPIARANYLLRAMKIPAGKHEVVFTFHPSSYYNGERIALIGSLILILVLAGSVFYSYKKSKEV